MSLGGAARLVGLGPSLLERGLVEYGVGLGVEDLLCEQLRLRSVSRDMPYIAVMNARMDGAEPVESSGHGAAVAVGGAVRGHASPSSCRCVRCGGALPSMANP